MRPLFIEGARDGVWRGPRTETLTGWGGLQTGGGGAGAPPPDAPPPARRPCPRGGCRRRGPTAALQPLPRGTRAGVGHRREGRFRDGTRARARGVCKSPHPTLPSLVKGAPPGLLSSCTPLRGHRHTSYSALFHPTSQSVWPLLAGPCHRFQAPYASRSLQRTPSPPFYRPCSPHTSVFFFSCSRGGAPAPLSYGRGRDTHTSGSWRLRRLCQPTCPPPPGRTGSGGPVAAAAAAVAVAVVAAAAAT